MKKSSFLKGSKDMLHRGFKPDKCKMSLRLVTSRLKLMRNKKEVQVKLLRRELAQLLDSSQDQTARIKVEHVVREEKMMAAYELISLYAELVMTRMPIIESQKNCPIDLKEAITSLIFATPRCSDITELVDVQKHFTAKYGKDFVGAAIELRPDCGVSRLLIEKLSVKAPDGQTKLKIFTAIAEEHGIKWDPKSFGQNDLTAPADLLNGPASFQAAAEHIQSAWHEPPQTSQTFQAPAVYAQSPQRGPSQFSQNETQYQPKPEQNDRFSQGTEDVNHSYSEGRPMSPFSQNEAKSSSPGKNWNMDFKDAASAAEAAAEAAERATLAAMAAADYANRDSMKRPYYTEAHQPSPHSKRDSSEFVELRKHPPNSYDSDRHHRSDSDQLQGDKFENPGGTPERSNKGGYDRNENYNQGHNLRSNDSVFDDSYGQASHDTGKYTQKRMYEDKPTKSDGIAKPQYNESKYRRDVNESSNSKDFHHIQAVDSQKSVSKDDAAELNIFAKPQFDEPEYSSDVHEMSDPEKSHNSEAVDSMKERETSYNLQPSIYDENSDNSDSDHRNCKSHSGTNLHFGIEQRQVHADTSRTGSGNSNFAVFDEASSDHEDISSDTGPKFDDHDPYSDSYSMPSGKEAPSNIFRIPSTQDFGFNGSKSPQKSAFQQSSSPEKHEFKFDDDEFPTKLDDSDGRSSEGEDSLDESALKSRIYLETLPGSADQFFPSPDESDEENLSETSSDLSSTLNYGNLTGGLRHKRHALPQSMRTRVDNTTVESSSKISTASITAQGQGNTEVKQNTNSRKNLSSSHDDSDGDSSEGERHVQRSISGSEPYTQPAVEDTETNSRTKVPVPYCEPDSDEVSERSKQISSGRNHMPTGLSRRTKANPASPARISEVQPNHGEPKNSNFSSERKSTFSSYDSHSNDEPKSRWTKDIPSGHGTPKLQPKREEPDDLNFCSDGSRFNEEPESVRTSAFSFSGVPKVQPKFKGTDDSDFSSGRKSTFSSYGSDFAEETESPRQSLGQLRNSEQSNPTRKSSKKIPESKPSFHQESPKSAVAQQPDIFQQKKATPSTTKTSQPDRKSTFSSYGSNFSEETESPRRSSGQLKNSEPEIFQQKKATPSTTKTSQPDRKSTFSSYGSNFSEETESTRRSSGQLKNSEPEIFQQKKATPSTTKTSQPDRKSTFSSYGSNFSEETESPRRSSGQLKNSEPEIFQQKKATPSTTKTSQPDRKSTFSSYGSNFSEETESPRRSSGQLKNSEPEIFQQKKATPITTKTSQPDRKSTFSSYGSNFSEETESPRRSSGQLKNSQQSNLTKNSSKQRPESKVSSLQESPKSAVAEKPEIIQQKEDTPGTIKTSQASQLTSNAPSKTDSSKTPSHVHPKLPDYDSFAAFFKR